MLSVRKIEDSDGAYHYFSEGDDRSDPVKAQWFGAGAERAGLTGVVRFDDFKAALEGRVAGVQVGHAGTKKVMGKNGKMKEVPLHLPGHDLTFSMPKSASIVAEVYGDKRVLEIEMRAARKALEVLQEHAAVTRQRGRDGSYQFKQTGELLAALFPHHSNRDGEPDDHIHAVVINATRDPDTGRWVSLWSREFYKAQREGNAVFINEVAAGFREIGFDLQWSVNEKGHPTFDVVGVPHELAEANSQRTRRGVDAQLAARGLTRETASPAAKEKATLASRKPKDHTPLPELRESWRAKARALGFGDYIDQPAPPVPPHDAVAEAREQQAADAAVAAATAQLAEREARFTRRELMVEARVYSQGRAGEKALGQAVDRAHERGLLIDRRVEIRAPGNERKAVAGYTTEAGAQTERSMLIHSGAVAEQGRDGPRIGETEGRENTAQAIDERIAAAERAAGYAFTDEHHAAVRGILEQRSGLAVVQGHAGTAKTTAVLAVIADHARDGGWKVRAMAPTSSAAQTLGDAIGAEPSTVASVIQRQQRDSAGPELWVADEAGMVSARDMDALLAKAERAGARVIVTGDDRQIGSVGAGRAFMQLQAEHPAEVYSLTDIKRQRSDELRAAIYDAIEGRAGEALGKVDVREQSDHAAAVAEVADAYMVSRTEGRDTLVVTLSRDDRAAVNAAIQERREAAGEVHDAETVRTLSDRQMTDAERADAARYQAGDVLQANRDFKSGWKRGETATVTSIGGGKITAQRTDGQTFEIDPARVNSYSVLRAGETRVGAGDELVAKGAVRAVDEHGEAVQLKNGEALTVTATRDGALDVKDRAGKAYMIDTREGARLDLAYAQTANQAQGKTVDRAIGYMRSSQTNLADTPRLYVTLSRARDSATIVTDDRAKLADTVARNAGRKSTALDQDLDRPARPSTTPASRDTATAAPARIPARDRALRSLAELEASTRRMVDQGRRNERHWAALQRADSARQGRAIYAQRREQQRQALVEQATSRIDKRERAELKAHARRNNYMLVPHSFKALRERWSIQRHAKEDKERIALAFSGERDSKRSRQLDARRVRDLKKEIRGVRKQAKEIKKAVSRGRSVLSPVRAWKRLQVDSRADDRVARIREKIDVVKARQADRKGRDLQAKAQAREALQRQREAAKAARTPRQQAPDRGEREDYSRGR